MLKVDGCGEVKIIAASEDHLVGITEIYNDAVRNTTATFDLAPKSLDEQRVWMDRHDGAHPIIVAILNDTVVGWGSLSPFSDRRCYERTVEDSVYVRDGFRGCSIGKLILERLLLEAKKAGHHAVVARVDAGNEASITLHSMTGFEEAGRLREVGYKFGQWLDVVIMQVLL